MFSLESSEIHASLTEISTIRIIGRKHGQKMQRHVMQNMWCCIFLSNFKEVANCCQKYVYFLLGLITLIELFRLTQAHSDFQAAGHWIRTITSQVLSFCHLIIPSPHSPRTTPHPAIWKTCSTTRASPISKPVLHSTAEASAESRTSETIKLKFL